MQSLEKYIVIIQNAMPHEVCDEIINEYKNSDDWCVASVDGGSNPDVIDKSVRNCSGIGISTQSVLVKNYYARKYLDSKVFSAASYALFSYKQKFPTCHARKDTGYDLLRYEEGQFYGLHTDSFAESPRELSCSFALNDGFKGGAFSFFGDEFVYDVKKGDAIMFPSNFMFPHEVKEVTEGTRYSIITWFS